MWLFDFTSLLLILAAGFELGLRTLGYDPAHAVLGNSDTMLFEAMGISAVWQFFRQRWI
jgi:hypothetical protein